MPDIAEDVTGYVLAGGRSSRMGRDKSLLTVEGMPLVQGAVTRLRMVCADVAILSGPANAERDAVLGNYARTVPDTDPVHSGPLAGVCAALADCATKYALVMAVDQPNMSADVLRLLVDAGKQEHASGACFTMGQVPQPLPLLLGRDLRTGILHAFLSGERKLLTAVLSGAATEGRMFLKLPLFGAENIFENLNTPDDMDRWAAARHVSSNHSNPQASE